MRLVTEDTWTEIDVPDLFPDGDEVTEFSGSEATLSLRMFLRLTHRSHLFLDRGWAPEEVFLSRYYWFRRFVTLQSLKYGFDAGLEQQAFQILEYPFPECEVDWSVLEGIENRISKGDDRDG